MKILLALDGSNCAMRAVRYVARHARQFGGNPEIHLLHAEPPLPGRAAAALSASVVKGYHRDEALRALAPAKRLLDRRRIGYRQEYIVGDPGSVIARYANRGRFSFVVMGSHGRGAISGLLLGSVVRKVLASCKVPVLIVR